MEHAATARLPVTAGEHVDDSQDERGRDQADAGRDREIDAAEGPPGEEVRPHEHGAIEAAIQDDVRIRKTHGVPAGSRSPAACMTAVSSGFLVLPADGGDDRAIGRRPVGGRGRRSSRRRPQVERRWGWPVDKAAGRRGGRTPDHEHGDAAGASVGGSRWLGRGPAPTAAYFPAAAPVARHGPAAATADRLPFRAGLRIVPHGCCGWARGGVAADIA